MYINELLEERQMTKYKLAKTSGVPQTTIADICSGRARIEKCSAETIYRIAKTLGVSMEDLIEPHLEKRCDFELFKSNVCHQLKVSGDIEFVIDVLKKDDINRYYKRRWYPEAFYLLGLLDYVSRENDIPPCDKYSDMRRQSLSEPIYPAGILAIAEASQSDEIIQMAEKEAIPELRRFNIIESEVRDVV